MFGRSRSWVSGGSGRSGSNVHSLDRLKYMYHVLTKNTIVTDLNRNLLVETIRLITEILIWGDQNDSSVFDFFLEKNMFVFFLNILRQKSGRYVCGQLLQTLNILFENITHETSLWSLSPWAWLLYDNLGLFYVVQSEMILWIYMVLYITTKIKSTNICFFFFLFLLEIEMVIMDRSKASEKLASSVTEQNITDEEKSAAAAEGNQSRPFLDMVYSALECAEEDYYALFVLCLLYTMSHNTGIHQTKLERIQLPPHLAKENRSYNHVLSERLIRLMSHAAQPDGKVRLATLELACILLKQLVLSESGCVIKDVHLACLEGAKEESVHLLRHFYKGEEIFLDMFEDEYRSMTSKPLNVEYLMMDASILLPPTVTPLTGIDFVKRLPCGDVERTRRAIRVFFMLRALSLQLREEPETQLPLTREEDLIKIDDVLDLNNSDLIACTVITKDGGQMQRFLAVDIYQMSLVEPDSKRLGWGVVKFAGLLQDMQVTGVEDDSRALNITIHKPASSPHSKPSPILQATFIFSDHIRCIIAKQRLAKGRIQARRMKMQRISALLDLPVQPSTEVMGFAQTSATAAPHLPFRFYEQSRRSISDIAVQRSVFASVDKVPGFAVAQCINQHTSSPAPPPSPPSSGSSSSSTGPCDSQTASSTSTPSATQSPSGTGQDDTSISDHPQATIFSQLESAGEPPSPGPKTRKSSLRKADLEVTSLAPTLVPAAQPTISLLSDGDTDALSVESLTLVPPVDSHSIHTFGCILQTSTDSESQKKDGSAGSTEVADTDVQ
ncbi:protein CLEC16A [Bombina bombina]|uniref:protein CLEC16A n=1 Tax=Bombina bombina TaxID=8345 RepID=UPI00235AC680|nr:protein CLEC16A [Bombina bombina]